MPMRWKVDEETFIPRGVHCEVPGHPNKDADGETQYDNTHFDTAAEAWAKARSTVEATLRMAGRDVAQAERALAKARQEAGEAATAFLKFTDAEFRWDPEVSNLERLADPIGELCRLVREAGCEMRLYGQPVSEDQLRRFAEKRALERIAEALVPDEEPAP